MLIAITPLVALSEAQLKLGAQAANWAAVDRARRSQTISVIASPGAAARRELLPSVAGRVE
jgi:hypothetical protein